MRFEQAENFAAAHGYNTVTTKFDHRLQADVTAFGKCLWAKHGVFVQVNTKVFRHDDTKGCDQFHDNGYVLYKFSSHYNLNDQVTAAHTTMAGGGVFDHRIAFFSSNDMSRGPTREVVSKVKIVHIDDTFTVIEPMNRHIPS